VYAQDESRFGLHTVTGRVLTAKGVKPICAYQHKFENTYLFGAFSPINGDSFLLELPYCNSECFQIYLNEFSKHKPTELKIVVLDNGAFHKVKSLIIPNNIVLVFLPPYSPELNPAEKIWWLIKQEFVCKTFTTLKKLSNYLAKIITKIINKKVVKSICGFDYLQFFF
jgi:transposase